MFSLAGFHQITKLLAVSVITDEVSDQSEPSNNGIVTTSFDELRDSSYDSSQQNDSRKSYHHSSETDQEKSGADGKTCVPLVREVTTTVIPLSLVDVCMLGCGPSLR